MQDLRGWFWKTYPNPQKTQSLDIDRIKTNLQSQGYSVEITTFTDLDLTRNFENHYILYGSSEDLWGGTKDYFEDILLQIQLRGGLLLPRFEYFRAHHNKVMMEILRSNFSNPSLKTITSNHYPNQKYALAALHFDSNYPIVIKSASGAGSQGVFLARSSQEYKKSVDRATRIISGFVYLYFRIKNVILYVSRKPQINFNNHKIVVQNLIDGLKGDYKVLVFGSHYYVLHRLNRKGDFRASGSGNFVKPEESEIFPVLNFAKICKQEIDTPHLSLDIGYDGHQCHLIEFQCISFGFKAMSLSQEHYVDSTSGWQLTAGPVNPEDEFCSALFEFLDTREIC